MRRLAAILLLLAALLPVTALAQAITDPWPDPDSVTDLRRTDVTFPSASPFDPADVLTGQMPSATARGILYLPSNASPQHRVPAVVLLHGAAGVIRERAGTYGPPLGAMGIATLAVDTFGSRPEMGGGFNARLLHITETMMVTDAYAALRYLDARPDIDPARVVLVGFSYGGMSTTYAMYRELADHLAAPGERFAGFVSYYGPCIARFADPTTTGAPLLMMYGTGDMLIRPDRCAQIVGDLRRGGSAVTVLPIQGAVHEWDGPFEHRLIGHDLSPCSFTVGRGGGITDNLTGLPMTGPLLREIELYNCVNPRQYPIGHDDGPTAESNRALGRFLASVFHIPDVAG